MIISIEEDLELHTQEEQERLRRTEKERKAKEEFMQKNDAEYGTESIFYESECK